MLFAIIPCAKYWIRIECTFYFTPSKRNASYHESNANPIWKAKLQGRSATRVCDSAPTDDACWRALLHWTGRPVPPSMPRYRGVWGHYFAIIHKLLTRGAVYLSQKHDVLQENCPRTPQTTTTKHETKRYCKCKRYCKLHCVGSSQVKEGTPSAINIWAQNYRTLAWLSQQASPSRGFLSTNQLQAPQLSRITREQSNQNQIW